MSGILYTEPERDFIVRDVNASSSAAGGNCISRAVAFTASGAETAHDSASSVESKPMLPRCSSAASSALMPRCCSPLMPMVRIAAHMSAYAVLSSIAETSITPALRYA